jgi:hypothetical protein
VTAGLGAAPDAAAAYRSYKNAHNLGHWKAALPIAELHMKIAGEALKNKIIIIIKIAGEAFGAVAFCTVG